MNVVESIRKVYLLCKTHYNIYTCYNFGAFYQDPPRSQHIKILLRGPGDLCMLSLATTKTIKYLIIGMHFFQYWHHKSGRQMRHLTVIRGIRPGQMKS
jgi:hypothetical protein